MMRVSIVTDEISSDLETALEIVGEWGMKYVELRGVGAQRVGQLEPYWEEHVYKTLGQAGVNVVALSPGVFKIPLPQTIPEGNTVLRWMDEAEYYEAAKQQALVEKHLQVVLPNTIKMAQRLGVPTIVVFGFIKPEGTGNACPEAVIAYLRQAAQQAERAGVTLALENEHICWADTAENTAKIIKQIGSKALRVNWDPGNAYFSNENPYPEGYQKIKEYLRHIHFKDVHIDPLIGKKQCVVHGEINWKSQLSDLQSDGYNGFISIETHCRPKIKSAKHTLDRIIETLGQAVLEE
jgi:sugar phosphate isomerase/epimerase